MHSTPVSESFAVFRANMRRRFGPPPHGPCQADVFHRPVRVFFRLLRRLVWRSVATSFAARRTAFTLAAAFAFLTLIRERLRVVAIFLVSFGISRSFLSAAHRFVVQCALHRRAWRRFTPFTRESRRNGYVSRGLPSVAIVSIAVGTLFMLLMSVAIAPTGINSARQSTNGFALEPEVVLAKTRIEIHPRVKIAAEQLATFAVRVRVDCGWEQPLLIQVQDQSRVGIPPVGPGIG